MGILILEASPDSSPPVNPPLPTLWVLPPSASLPPMDGDGIEEFVRLPVSREDIVRRVLGLVRSSRRARALERLEREAAKHPEQLRGIVTTIAHDLSSPLTAIIEYIELLLDGTIGSPTPEQQKLLAAAQQTARGLGERIGEIGT